MRCRGTWEDICLKRGGRGAIGYSRLIRWLGIVPSLGLANGATGNIYRNVGRSLARVLCNLCRRSCPSALFNVSFDFYEAFRCVYALSTPHLDRVCSIRTLRKIWVPIIKEKGVISILILKVVKLRLLLSWSGLANMNDLGEQKG